MDNFDTESFIAEIERRPPIWNCSSEEYSNRELKKQCWDDIVEIFGGKNMVPYQRIDMEFTLQKKWKGIRGCFTRELKRQERMLAGGDPGPRKSEYIHFQQLHFLRNFALPRDSDPVDYIYPDSHLKQIKSELSAVSDLIPDGGDDNEGNDNNEDNIDPLMQEYSNKKRKCDIEDNEDKMFLLSMLSTLQSVPKAKKMMTKIKLMTVLEEATKDLND